MMNYLLKLLLIPAIFLTDETIASSCGAKRELVYQGESIALCYEEKAEHYLSESCSKIQDCFFQKKIDLSIYPNQSPGFSLCFQLGGEPFFGRIKHYQLKIPLCKLNGHYIDQENLLGAYFRSR